jgi:hypothetical protein
MTNKSSEYYLKNKDRIKQKSIEYYHKHRDKIKQYQKKYFKKYYQLHRDEIIRNCRIYYLNCTEERKRQMREYMRRYYNDRKLIKEIKPKQQTRLQNQIKQRRKRISKQERLNNMPVNINEYGEIILELF